MPSGAKDPPRCLIVDDHPVVRAGVRSVLSDAFAGASVVDAASVDEALDALGDEVPDVVDRGPVEGRPRHRQRRGPPGREPVRADRGVHLRRRRAPPGEALKAGVKGYVRKDSPSEDLIRAIDARPLGRVLRRPRPLVDDRARRGRPHPQRPPARDPPDARRRDADGCRGERLGLSTETVRTPHEAHPAKLEALDAHPGRGDRHPPRHDRLDASAAGPRSSRARPSGWTSARPSGAPPRPAGHWRLGLASARRRPLARYIGLVGHVDQHLGLGAVLRAGDRADRQAHGRVVGRGHLLAAAALRRSPSFSALAASCSGASTQNSSPPMPGRDVDGADRAAARTSRPASERGRRPGARASR